MTTEMIAQCQYFFMYDEPVPYKNLMIYPVTMKEYIPFFTCVDCLMINKNTFAKPRCYILCITKTEDFAIASPSAKYLSLFDCYSYLNVFYSR